MIILLYNAIFKMLNQEDVTMYDIDGDFGKVRLVHDVETKSIPDILDYSLSFGWHECNDKYRIARENGSERFLILFTVSGLGVLKTENATFELTANSVAIIPPDVFHEYFAKSLWEFYWMHPQGFNCEKILNYIFNEKGFVSEVASVLPMTDKIEHLLLLNSSKSCDYDVEASMVISELLHTMISKMLFSDTEKNRDNELVMEIKEFLEHKYKTNISLSDLSKKMYISPVHIIRVFKAKTGLTPYEYLLHYRIAKACELLEFTNLQISNISEEVGFKSASNFILHFKRIKGITPNSFRNRR